MVDMALSQVGRWVRIESTDNGVWAMTGAVDANVLQVSQKRLKLSDSIGTHGAFLVPVYYLLCAAKFFAGDGTATVEFSDDLGPVRVSVNMDGLEEKQLYLMPHAMAMGLVPEQWAEFGDVGRRDIKVTKGAGELVSAKGLTSGDVIEKGAERFLVWWVSLDLDLIKLESLDGHWKRTGKIRVNRLSSYEKQSVYWMPLERESDGTVSS